METSMPEDTHADIRQLRELVATLSESVHSLHVLVENLKVEQKYASRLPCSKCIELEPRVLGIEATLTEFKLAKAARDGGLKVTVWVAGFCSSLIGGGLALLVPWLLSKV